MGYKRWRPNSRRDRRRGRKTPRATTQGADRSFIIIVGLFCLSALLILAAIALFGR